MSLSQQLSRIARIQLAPPAYLSTPAFGIDLSAAGIKVARPKEHFHGLELNTFGDGRIAQGSISNGEILDRADVVRALRELRDKYRIQHAYVGMPESRGYMFEATVAGKNKQEWRLAVEQRLEEYVPLPPAEVMFDVVPHAQEGDKTHLIGMGYARRTVEEILSLFDEARIEVLALESETFALPRSLLPVGTTDTVMIIDIGRSSTKLLVTSKRLPRLATTLDIGGHALTLAVQKYFGVTEEEAKRVKAEKGLVPGPGSEDYLAAMLSTVSAIREEIVRRFDYWESRKSSVTAHSSITRAVLVGGNATVRGLPEYLETGLKVPVELGNIFTNFAPSTHWLPSLEYSESLGYGTVVGLSLRDYVL